MMTVINGLAAESTISNTSSSTTLISTPDLISSPNVYGASSKTQAKVSPINALDAPLNNKYQVSTPDLGKVDSNANDSKLVADPSKIIPTETVTNKAVDEVDFQRFVRQSTGQSLRLYGYELFGNGGFEAVQAATVPAGYVLGPGDEIGRAHV